MARQGSGAEAVPGGAIAVEAPRWWGPLKVGREVLRFAQRKPLGAFGAALVLGMVVMAIFAPFIATHEPLLITRDRLLGPSGAHWFGTDNLGRDTYSLIVYGARTSVTVGFLSVAILTTLATFLGVTSGYLGGIVDTWLQRFVDAVMALPTLPILLVALLVLPPNMITIAVVIGLLFGPSASRVIRGATMSVKENDYIQAARSVGASSRWIILRHILPNVFAPIMVIATVFLGSSILIEASLSFLAVGGPEMSWGKMVSIGAVQYMQEAPWMAVFPGVAIALVVFGVNMLGDALRDVMDPSLRGA